MPRRAALRKHLRTIRRSTRVIARAVTQLSSQLRRVERQAKRNANPGKRKLRISPQRRAQLKLQGAYMGYMRQLGPRQKARVKAEKEKRGIGAAIGVAKKIAK